MDKIRKTFLLAGNNFRKWSINPRIYMILLLLIGYLNMMLSPVRDFCKTVEHPITPWVFPFLMAQPYSLLMILLGFILLLCDAPFIESEQPYIITRSGRILWTGGQIVYIVLTSALYFLTVVFLTIILLSPYTSLEGGWGKVINTFSQGNAARYGVVIPFDYTIVKTLSPAQAMLMEFFVCWLLGIVLGILMFCINLVISRSAGAIIAAGIAILPLFVRKTNWRLHYVSPASWVSLSVLDIGEMTSFPSVSYAISGFLLLTAILTMLAILSMRHRDIDVLKSV